MKERMMKGKLGRILRRLFGEEAGAVMMEYVIVAVLVAAAAVVGIIYFSRTMSEQGASATNAMAGQTKEATDHADKAKQEAAKGATESKTYVEKFSDVK